MLVDSDRLSLPPGVVLRDGTLADAVRGTAWPINGTGAFVVARSGSTVAQIAGEIAAAFSLPLEAARRDVLRFAWHLNALALVNVSPTGSRVRRATAWLGLALRLAPLGATPGAVARRRALDTATTVRAIGSTFRALAPRVVAVGGTSVVLAAQLTLVAGAVTVVLPLAVGAGTGIGLAIHEAAHSASLVGVPSALVTRGRKTSVLHAPVGPRRRALVALSGPLVACSIGAALVSAGLALSAPELAVTGCPLAAHALGLTVAAGDGRVACSR